MPDQYDPKVSPRPNADRRQADARRSATMVDDPLAELAKIVQGRPSNGAAAPSRQATAAAAAPQTNGSSGLDLEAELLNDLQASFAAVRDVFPSPPAAAPPRQQAAPARPPVVMDEAPVIAAPAPKPVPQPPQPTPPPQPRNEMAPELRNEFRLEPVDQTRLVPIPAPPVIQPMIQSSAPPAPQPRPLTAERRPEPAPEKAAEPLVVERPAPQPRQSAPAPDLGAFQLRGSAIAGSSPPTLAAPTKQPHSRWEKPEPPRAQPAAASRFAPPRTAAPVMDDEPELDPFAEGGLFADQFEPPAAEDEFPLEDLGTLPGYAEEEHLPPLEDDLEGLSPRRGVSRNLIVVLGVVLIALVGGLGVAFFHGGNAVTGGGTPPVIAADGNPTKITPDETAAANETDGQNKLIYDRVNSGDQGSTDTTLLTPDNGPIKDVGSDTAANPISRVIIPGGPGIDAPGAGSAQQPAAVAPAPGVPGTPQPDAIGQVAANDAAATTDPNAIQPIGPRKVRTVVVKPDGTIVSSAAADDGATAVAAAPPTATVDTPAAKPAATDAVPAPAVTDDTAAITGNDSNALTITAPPADGTTAAADAPADATAPVATAPVADAAPAAKPAATKPGATKPAKPAGQQVAAADTTEDGSPIDITAAPATPPAASGVLVQISSQRTEDAARATYRDLQARYPNILGSYDVNIQRADVPDRGTFYRVRVGPFSQNDAQRLCDDLRQAGGDCVLAKR